MLLTKAATAAPGAYQALVPSIPVNVAPPTMVSAATFFKVSASINCETGTPVFVANRVNGIIVVSPWPPITTPLMSLAGAFKAKDK